MQTQKTEDQARLDTESTELNDLFFRVGMLYRRRLHTDLADYNLTGAQFAAMHSIRKHGNCMTVCNLAESIHQVAPTVTGIINRLEERGLVIRRRDPKDRRNQLLSVSPEGQTILDNIQLYRQEQFNEFLKLLAPTEREELIRLLRKFLSTFTEFHLTLR